MTFPLSTVNKINNAADSVNKNAYYTSQLVKYVNNEALEDKPDSFVSTIKSDVACAGLFEGIPIFNFLRKSKKLSGSRLGYLNDIAKNNTEALNKLKLKDTDIITRIKNYISDTVQTNKEFRELQSSVKTEYADKFGKKAAEKVTEEAAEKVTEKAVEKVTEEVAEKVTEKASKGYFSKIAKTIGNGFSKISKTVGSSKIGKFIKTPAGGMIVFNGIIELLTEVVPTFKELGAEKGIKQLGKSTVKAVSDALGFILGEQAGIAAGTAIGTAICPGIGSAVGAVVGFIGGMAGSFAAGKINDLVLGKSEREILKEKEDEQNAKKIFADSSLLKDLQIQAKAKIQEEIDNGLADENTQLANEALENINNANVFAA